MERRNGMMRSGCIRLLWIFSISISAHAAAPST
ncbi:contactin-associated protein-like 2 isoform X1, partial [Tachysurus ichikawai]